MYGGDCLTVSFHLKRSRFLIQTDSAYVVFTEICTQQQNCNLILLKAFFFCWNDLSFEANSLISRLN